MKVFSFQFIIGEYETSVMNHNQVKRWIKLFDLRLSKRFGSCGLFSNYWQVVNHNNEHVGLLQRL